MILFIFTAQTGSLSFFFSFVFDVLNFSSLPIWSVYGNSNSLQIAERCKYSCYPLLERKQVALAEADTITPDP